MKEEEESALEILDCGSADVLVKWEVRACAEEGSRKGAAWNGCLVGHQLGAL